MLRRLYLRFFRNCAEAEITFSPQVNWLVGKNAQGKTNLLEAIYLLSCGRSFRTAQLGQLIQAGRSYFHVEGEIEQDGVRGSIQFTFDGKQKKIVHNATTYRHFAPLIGNAPMILYAPEDTALIGGGPSHRRKFLDLQLAQTDRIYLHHLARFYRALQQRNALLKDQRETTIDAWEEMMAHSAHYLMEKRKAFISSIKAPLRERLLTLSLDADLLELEYQPSLAPSDPAALIASFEAHRKKELQMRTTLYGPHRDDLLFSVDGFSARSHASVGQTHSIAAALKLCSWQHLKAKTEKLPLFGVDDFGAHLDTARGNQFEAALRSLGQIFLTSQKVGRETFSEANILEINSGKVLHVSSP